MNEHKAVPNIRFKGYEEGWRDKKTLELVSERNSKIIPSDDYPLKAFIAKKGITEKGKKYNRSFLVKSRQKKYKKTEYGDLIYSSNNLEVGSIGINRYGNACISPVYSIFKVNDSLSYDFLGYLIQRKEFIFNMVRYRQGVTYGQWKIHESDFLNIQVLVPESIDEQQKIGDFFTRLDKLLDLQQQKIDKLELLKKALLQKLFPKHDTKIPELRFKEFKNEWEKEKLKGYIEKVSGNDGRMNLPTLTISAAKGWMNQNERFSNNIAGKEQKNYTLLKKGELSYNHGNSKLFKYGVVYELINYDEALVPKVYHSFRVNSKASARFIEYLFRGKKVDRELRKLVTSGARMDGLLNINFNNFENIQLYFPEKAEQQKIGNLLSKVDQLIELENKKLQNFQQVKKRLLQNMFVE